MYSVVPLSKKDQFVKVPSAFVAIAVARLLNSVSISVPLTILDGSPEVSASLDAKLVLLV